MRRYADVRKLLELYAQEWLERGSVGFEVLGAEPLSVLIDDHVLRLDKARDSKQASADFVERLKDQGIQFIATMSNLNRGRLDLVHVPANKAQEQGARLIEALLASSAFPAVFRPRWSWEVNPRTSEVHQYIDGGVMDNLPLDAVTQFLHGARREGRVAARPHPYGADKPGVPHLLFAGSLEVERLKDLPQDEVERMAGHWRRTMKRAKQLTYNNKIFNYALVQDVLREIHDDAVKPFVAGGPPSTPPYVPLDLEVVVVKPKWLCGTFAFHPMLGFRRIFQARSIAHGCYTTFKRLYDMAPDHASSMTAWGITPPAVWKEHPDPTEGRAGNCWYREGCLCPFSRAGMDAVRDDASPVLPETTRMLARIHAECGRQSVTHAPKD